MDFLLALIEDAAPRSLQPMLDGVTLGAPYWPRRYATLSLPIRAANSSTMTIQALAFTPLITSLDSRAPLRFRAWRRDSCIC
jgi:hypothetical protein